MESQQAHDDISTNNSDDDAEDVDMDVVQADQFPLQVMSLPSPDLSHSTLRLPSLTLGSFQWSNQPEVTEPSHPLSSEDEEDTTSAKKQKRKKQIAHDLTADMHTKAPESNADFERLLLGSPNSSYLWIQYMSFQLQLSEVDKAKEIAQRALQTIHFREEQEKLNVWIALLNLECAYGTEDSLENAFKAAARANDSKTVHLRLAAILEQAEKYEVSYCTRRSLLQ